MTDPLLPVLFVLIRSTVMLTLSGLLIGVLFWGLRITSPSLRRAACFLVILSGWFLVQIPVTLPWSSARCPAAR